MAIQEDILQAIQAIDDKIAELQKQRSRLETKLDRLYYVMNVSMSDAPMIIVHGTEEYCRQYMKENYPSGAWYHGSNQFAPMHNPKRINWALLHNVNKADKKEWEIIQNHIKSPSRDTERAIIAMMRG